MNAKADDDYGDKIPYEKFQFVNRMFQQRATLN